MILNELSVKFQFTYKNTPSVFRWGILFAISVCFSDRRGRRSLQNNFIILRRGDSRIARFMLFSSIKRTAEDVGPYKKTRKLCRDRPPGRSVLHLNNSLSAWAPPRPCSLRGLFRNKIKLGFSIYFCAVL